MVWSYASVAHETERFAHTLRRNGLGLSQAVALWAPNSPQWIIAALAIMAAGGVLVAIDDLSDPEQAAASLDASGAGVLLVSANHLPVAESLVRTRSVSSVVLDTALAATPPSGSACAIEDAFPELTQDAPAMFGWTSGTTGSPKGFLLSHGNIGSNVEALCALDIVRPDDRVLQPLPLHHAYPFVVGTLTPLAIGATIVLPAGTTGPLLLRALHDGAVTIVVGVPRLYEAMLAAIGARAAARGWAVRALWHWLMRMTIWVQHRCAFNPGRWWFAPIRRAVAPHVRYLVSGGARLQRESEEQLNALGWTVLVGYGLAETASLFTGNTPRARRVGSAGKPLADGQIRITAPDPDGVGEIELRGPAVTRGYANDADATRASFTSDGWLRTGDLGFVDRDGFLHVTGRRKEILVLGGGKKIDPEELERVYGRAPQVREIALLEERGALVALVRPDLDRVRDLGTLNLREGIRVTLSETARSLPAYQRLAGFALTDQPLPRTRLGKYRRFLLPALYRQALGEGPARAPRPLSAADEALLRDPTAAAVWALLRERYPARAIDLDVTLALDLNLDSFGWMELAIAVQDRCGVQLTEADSAAAETIRDLLRRCAERRGQTLAERSVSVGRQEYLAPASALVTLLGVVLYAINWGVMHLLFRLRVIGMATLPASGSFVITPNHASFLDPLAIAAALPLSCLRRTYWAGTVGLLFRTRLRRLLSRAAHVFPVDEARPDDAFATCAELLRTGRVAVWFPEGWRSPDGTLQRFLPGIGRVLLQADAPAVPVHIAGSFAAWPRGRVLPKPARITVTFGRPEPLAALRASGGGASEEQQIVQALRQRVADLGRPA